jgi:hypothetical protein
LCAELPPERHEAELLREAEELVGAAVRQVGRGAERFHAIRDLTADSLGGWKAVTNIQAGGGLYAQRIVTRKYYDLAGAKRRALAYARIPAPPEPPKRAK